MLKERFMPKKCIIEGTDIDLCNIQFRYYTKQKTSDLYSVMTIEKIDKVNNTAIVKIDSVEWIKHFKRVHTLTINKKSYASA